MQKIRKVQMQWSENREIQKCVQKTHEDDKRVKWLLYVGDIS